MRTNGVELPYYSYDRVLSYNAPYTFVVGGRGLGKTYGAQKMAVRNYLRKGEMFIYLRRYRDELKAARSTFFAAFAHEFPGHVFRMEGNAAQVAEAPEGDEKPKWETMGYLLCLSTAQQQKSVAFPQVTLIVYDEFIIEKGLQHYIPGELDAFNNFYNTVDRYKDKTRVLFLANSVMITNPYFMGLGIKVPEDGDMVRLHDGFVVCHFPDAAAFAAKVYETRFGKFIRGTEYADYAVGNVFRDNNDSLIDPKGSDARYLYTVEMGEETAPVTLSFWRNGDNQWFVQQKRPKGDENMFTLFPSRMAGDRMLFLSNDRPLQLLRGAFRQGRMFFDEPRSRNAFLEVFKK